MTLYRWHEMKQHKASATKTNASVTASQRHRIPGVTASQVSASQDARSHSVTALPETQVSETQVSETQVSECHSVQVSERQRFGEAERQRKRGARLESPGGPYISTTDGLFWTKGVFFGA